MRAARGRPRCTRRAFLSSLLASSVPVAEGTGREFPPERQRYIDPSTEFAITRMTDPQVSCFLPPYYDHAISRRRNALLYTSDRSGSLQIFQMDLKSGKSRQLSDARELDGDSVAMLHDERSICYFDGPALRQTNLSNLRGREIYRVPEGWSRAPGLAVSIDGVHAAFVETQGETRRLRLVGIARGNATTVVEAGAPISRPLPRPRRAGILYERGGDSLWLVNYDGADNRPLKIAPGGIGPATWSADGRTVLYLSFPEEPSKLNMLREHTPDTNADELVAPTSQFVHFGRNRDSSVFVGASRNKAAPYVLLLLRVTRREMTLCEHRASDPSAVAPIFSPDSQWVYFQSDRDGKPAIYAIPVEKFVEKTES